MGEEGDVMEGRVNILAVVEDRVRSAKGRGVEEVTIRVEDGVDSLEHVRLGTALNLRNIFSEFAYFSARSLQVVRIRPAGFCLKSHREWQVENRV